MNSTFKISAKLQKELIQTNERSDKKKKRHTTYKSKIMSVRKEKKW